MVMPSVIPPVSFVQLAKTERVEEEEILVAYLERVHVLVSDCPTFNSELCEQEIEDAEGRLNQMVKPVASLGDLDERTAQQFADALETINDDTINLSDIYEVQGKLEEEIANTERLLALVRDKKKRLYRVEVGVDHYKSLPAIRAALESFSVSQLKPKQAATFARASCRLLGRIEQLSAVASFTISKGPAPKYSILFTKEEKKLLELTL